MSNSTHRVNVVRIREILPHPNADTLGIVYIDGMVPMVYRGPYDAVRIKEMAEGKSLVDGAKHIREGIVISSATERQVRGSGRAQLKLKSLKFLEKENA